MRKPRWIPAVIIIVSLLFSSISSCGPPVSESELPKTPSSLPEPPSPTKIPSELSSPKQEPQKTQTVTLGKGWKTYTDKDQGYEIALPDLWEVVPKEKIEKLGLNFSGGPRIFFYAVDIFTTAIAIAEGKPKVLEFANSLSISEASIIQEMSLADLEEKNVRNLETDPDISKPIFHKRVELTAGEALKLKYTIKLPNRTEAVVFVQYLLIKETKVYYFTFETLPYLLERLEPNYEKIANSFLFTK